MLSIAMNAAAAHRADVVSVDVYVAAEQRIAALEAELDSVQMTLREVIAERYPDQLSLR